MVLYLWSHSVKTGVWLRAKEMEINATLWAVRLEKDFTFTLRWNVFSPKHFWKIL